MIRKMGKPSEKIGKRAKGDILRWQHYIQKNIAPKGA